MVFMKESVGPFTERDGGQIVRSCDIGAKDMVGKIKQETKHLGATEFMCDLGQVTFSL